jgi:acyl phosphate:glycerol-3-phosphate acyltransferase
MFIPWTILSFIIGALPFSVWIGKVALKVDIRQYGDKNPGATNVLRAGGYGWFFVALMLDISKGAAPVGMAYYIFGWQGWEILPIALAPPLGHTFSPFLNWRGGKALASAYGVWIGLTLWTMPLISILAIILFALLITPSGWAVMAALAVMLGALLLWLQDPIFLAVWAGQTALLIYNHRADLGKRPQLRPLAKKRGSGE